MGKKICIKCSTENEEHFSYCKYCGASLPVVDRQHHFYGDSGYSVQTDPKEIDFGAVSRSELEAYVGKNKEKIMPKLVDMELEGKKTSFCIPVFLLGFFAGFLGMSCWFFYRKMYKIGAILVALGLLISFADIAVNMQATRNLFSSTANMYFSDYENEESLLNEAERIMYRYEQEYNPVFSFINNYVGRLVAPIVFAFYAFYLYKQTARERILRLKSEFPSDPFLEIRISSLGGCSLASVIIPFLFELVPALLTMVICLL